MSDTSSYVTSSTNDPDEPTHLWVFHGNCVIPTRNPFETTSTHINEENVNSSIVWLGPGLKLCLDQVIAVDQDGIIVLMAHEDTLDVKLLRRRKNYVRLKTHEFLCPGFIDLHLHAPQFTFTGTATDTPLMGPDGWLETYTFPAERSLKNDKYRARNTFEGVVRTTLQAGTTTACYFGTLDLEPCQTLVDIAINLGQRSLVGKICMDRNSPSDYVQSTQQNVDETRSLIAYIHRRAGKEGSSVRLPMVMPIITPRFIPTCTSQLMSELGALAKEYNCHIQSHISESMDEIQFSRHLDETTDGGSGRSDAEIFDSHNLLSTRCIMAHGVHLTDSDMTRMKDRGAACAHCPLSNFFFAGGSFPCRKWMEQGNKVGLGTDVAGGYSPSMMNSQRMAVIASQSLQHQQEQSGETSDCVLDYRHAFYLATLGGAQALGLENKIGTLAVGMELDAIILSANVKSPIQIFDSDSVADVFQKLCTLGDDRNIKQVYVQGRKVMEEGNLLIEC